ncbi:aminopeptidase P family protein [Halalkalirubrum salinum]|uniref:aminopeptidase P family protein n=1 Tax=Halalkalirubrum salinum TaxID=2563889 RepID=UPI0010FB753D|nr:aminopeptidase P family protein [Halalkalirubrum salinum]
MESSDAARRIRSLQAQLESDSNTVCIMFPGRNLQYLTGFYEEPTERHFLFFVPADRAPIALVPELSAADFNSAAPWVDDIRTWTDEEGPQTALSAALDVLAPDRILLDDTMWARFTQDIRTHYPEATYGLASEALTALRICKDATEIDALEHAGQTADTAMNAIRSLGSDAIGMTEVELARRIETELVEAGGTGTAFETIVGSGPNGARPHHTSGDRAIRPGEPVVLDFGTRVDGYPSDQTRTIAFDGEPTDRVCAVHEVVKEAQAAAIDAIEPGVTAESIDRAAREVIEAAGYGDRFIHRTGHGVGLDVHEAPDIVAGNERKLEPGMVFSVEPGIYLPDEFGIRIEDLVVVTDDGAMRLNRTDRGL